MEKLDEKDFRDLLKYRENDTNKGDYGYIGIIGGSVEYSGAIKLANMSAAAVRSGCGVTRVIVPDSIVHYIAPYLLEQTIYRFPTDEKGFMKFDLKSIDDSLYKLKAIAIGMGWGNGKDNSKILSYILDNKNIPCIIDADGLNTLSKMSLDILSKSKCKIILTPHLKEFSRLTNKSIEEIKENPINLATDFAKRYNVILLLKGHKTIVTNGNIIYEVTRGCPGMATAGSGDVLSGVLVGLLGYKEPSTKLIAQGAYLAGMAGELAQDKYTDISMKASDTIEMIPKAIKILRSDIEM